MALTSSYWPADTSYRPRELDDVLRQSRAAGLFHVRGFRGNPMAETVAELRPELRDLRQVVEIERWEEFLASGSDATKLPEVRPEDPAQIGPGERPER